jgi:homoserine dehydrogenase
VVHAYEDLRVLAQQHKREFLFEATVMGGAPIFSLFRDSLPALKLLRFRGLLNSTSSVIISEMEQGRSFEEGVRAAQEMGIAETDPTADIDGWDATVKVCAIATVLMDTSLKLGEIQREGIRNLTPDWVQAARGAGTPYKLVSTIERTSTGQVIASVKPERLSAIDPLAAVNGGSMLAHFETDVLAGLTVTLDVPDSDGPRVTAYDVMADFIHAVSHHRQTSGD